MRWFAVAVAGACIIGCSEEPRVVAPPASRVSAVPDSANVTLGQSIHLSVLQNDSLSPGSAAALRVVGIALSPQHGSATFSAAGIDYTASATFVGADTIAYIASDPSTGARDTGTVRVNVTPGPYTVTALGALGAFVIPAGINNRGQVAVTIVNPDSTRRVARWESGQYTLLASPPGADTTIAVAINNSGDVLGAAGHRYTYGGPAQAVVWHAGTTAPDVLMKDSLVQQPTDINDRGEVLFGFIEAGIYSAGTVTALNAAGCVQAVRLNNRGEALMLECGQLYPHWLVLPATAAPPYGTCGHGRYSAPADINDAGTIVGSAEHLSGTNEQDVCVWRQGGPSGDLRQTLGSWLTTVTRINNREWMLGAANRFGQPVPVLIIGNIVAPLVAGLVDSAWKIDQVVDINDVGQILAFGVAADGVRRPVVLTPAAVPPAP